MVWYRRAAILSIIGACLALPGCSDSPAEPSGNAAATITLSSTGVAPIEVRVPVGSQVLFVNNDSRTHAMSSDPIQVHTDCPAVNDVGTLAPGQRRMTGTLNAARTCGFHDHMNEFDNTWKGRIVVQ